MLNIIALFEADSIGPETAAARFGWRRVRRKILILLASPTGFEPVLSP
jgi:hypothetical protein